METVFVTGGAGFIGSVLISHILNAGKNVVNLDALTYAASKLNTESFCNHNNYHFVEENILNRTALETLLHEYKPASVLHLAAESHVDSSIESPKITVQTNIIGTFNILEASLKYWIASGRPSGFRFQHISTDEVFGTLNSRGSFSEKSPYKPRNPYSASKAASDHLVTAWFATYGLPTLITNCSNNYGRNQHPEKLIPKIILNGLSGSKIPIYGDGKNVRDWLHVDDHANALLTVLERGKPGQRYNIGGDGGISNIDLALKICSLLDKANRKSTPHARLIEFVNDRPGHDFRYSINSKKIKKQLGWLPKIGLEDGLHKTIQWYEQNREFLTAKVQGANLNKSQKAKR